MSRIQKHTDGYKSDAEINAILQRRYEEALIRNEELQKTISELQETIANLNDVIANLTARLNMNSRNSSLPPSHDVVSSSSKNRSLRTKSGKKVGGQPNHKGSTRELVDDPDEVVHLTANQCSCGCSLKDVPVDHIVRRQEIEIPALKHTVVEYQGDVKKCPQCGKMIPAEFPKEVPNTISLGPNLQADIIYNRIHLCLPVNKIVDTHNNRYSLKLSAGTIESKVHEMASVLTPFIHEVKGRLLGSKYIHCDETGVRIEGKRQWLHTIGTSKLTVYHAHEKRGAEAMIENGVLPQYLGTIMSDYWLGYNKFPANHTFCKAHIIRETR